MFFSSFDSFCLDVSIMYYITAGIFMSGCLLAGYREPLQTLGAIPCVQYFLNLFALVRLEVKIFLPV